MDLEILEAPEEAWAEEHSWHNGDDFELKIPRDQSPQVMMLPLWGWARVAYRYRLTKYEAEADSIDRIDADVFEGPNGRVLVVEQYDGIEGEMPLDGDDYTYHLGAQVWEAPARVAEPPVHLVDRGGRYEFQDWLLDRVAPKATHWWKTRNLGVDTRFEEVSIVDPGELADWLVEAAERLHDDLTFGWSSRDITIADEPTMVVHYPDGRFQVGAIASWALAYEGRAAGVDFMMVLVFKRWRDGKLEQQGQVVWGDEVEAAIDAHGEQEGLARLLTREIFDRNAPTLRGSVPF